MEYDTMMKKIEELEKQLQKLNTEKNILDTLCQDYVSFFYLDFEKKQIISLKKESKIALLVNPETDEADFTEYKKRLEQCFRQYVEKSSAPDFVDTLSPEHLLAVLTRGERLAYRFSTVQGQGVQHHLEVTVSPAEGNGTVAVMGFRMIDDIIAQEERKKQELQRVNTQLGQQLYTIGGLSNAYFAVYWVDLQTDE